MKDFNYKKKFGQNFLNDQAVIDKIIDCVNPDKDDLIIEVGPGSGNLTKELKKFRSNLVCYELDEETKKYLIPLEDLKTKIIYQDFLKVDLNNLKNEHDYKKLYVIANLPYYITTPIIEHLINSELNVNEMVLMVQDEVADRLSARPCSKSYGSLTVYLNYYFEIEKLFVVKKTSFFPIPNVDSAIVKFKKREKQFNVFDEDLFFKIVKTAFKQKRKNIKNNLFEYDLLMVEEVLKSYNKTLQSRAEELSINCFIDIANSILTSKSP